ncbi:hypothetical protein [Acinetobacter sp. YH12200]|uniref:hypothetical protein n=1 Tax=Acinetobacter sp. YH12200 TaxID=2601139 RepID=UPI0015D3507D|nr:hypothetical protein [Acinetobacter sp. YH12200]
MNFTTRNEIGARFKLIARKKDGSIARETDWFLNKVLASGLAQMSVGTWINRCCVGSGNSTPTSSQTSLDTLVASTTSFLTDVGVSHTTSPIYFGARRTWRFGEGVAAGNISEVGMGWSDAAMWNRALIRDILGNPTTITVLSDEFLDVVAEIRVYPPEIQSGSFNVTDKSGAVLEAHSYECIPLIPSPGTFSAQKITAESLSNGAVATLHSSGIQTITTGPSQPSHGVQAPQTTQNNPTPNSLGLTFSLRLSDAVMSIKSIRVGFSLLSSAYSAGGAIGYQLEISPPFNKTNLMTVNIKLNLTWSEYTGGL